MNDESRFPIDDRRGSAALIEQASGGHLWEAWRLAMEEKLHNINQNNEDRALLERALRGET